MADKLAALQKTHKTLQTKAKAFTKQKGEKLKKLVLVALDRTWAAEDAFVAALKEAQAGGMKGSKPADFSKDRDFSKTLAAFKKAAAVHEKEVKNLRLYCDGAMALLKTAEKLQKDVEKEIGKSKDKQHLAFKKEIAEMVDTVKLVANLTGTMKLPELYYGASFQKVLDRIMKDTKDDGAALGDLDKILEDKTLAKNEKLAAKKRGLVDDHCSKALEMSEGNPKAAMPALKKADGLIKDLAKMNKSYQAAKKKHDKKIKEEKDQRKILKSIAAIKAHHDDAAKNRAETVKKVTGK